MEEDNLFMGLPPPSAKPNTPPPPPLLLFADQPSNGCTKRRSTPAPAPVSILKSALKREKPPQPQNEAEAEAPQKRLRFKTTVDASETKVIEAMQKVASHIKNPTKFGKASKLAIQLIQAGSVNPGTSDHFFGILEAAMSSSPTACTDASVRADYHALFLAAQDINECLNNKQRNQLTTWTVRAVVGNDLYTDDSFVFSKAAGRIKEAISSLPVATSDDDIEEAVALKDESEVADADREEQKDKSSTSSEAHHKAESDPFGLDALLTCTSKKDEKLKGKKEAPALSRKAEESETKRFLQSQREALILCLEIAARRYKIPWCQTVIDILVKHAFDNVERFTSRQRDAIRKLWASIREQHTHRKQGKSVTGKLDMNAFDFLQQKYASEKISIRRAVGGGGDRRAQQWLG